MLSRLTHPMTLNDPALVKMLEELHDAYEEALAANDVEALDRFFWNSPCVVRYGVAEQLYGADAVRAYRQTHSPPFTNRRIVRREVCTFGSDCATVMSEIELLINGVPRRNRQSQTWARLPELGWRIVSAHVSVPIAPVAADSPWAAYADSAARALDLPIAADHRPGVAANLERTAAIAAPLMAFPLSDEAEPAPVFTP
jgi:hypothetical protein